MFAQLTFWDIPRFISSPGSEAGASPLALPDGPTTVPSGPGPRRVSHSRTLEPSAAPPMSATSGPSCATSSPSADLQLSLESRLRAALDSTGSPLYALTWRPRAMQSGPQICALRGRALRTSDNVSTGERSSWPTPVQQDGASSARTTTNAEKWNKDVPGNTDHTSLDAARLASWATPVARDYKHAALTNAERGRGMKGDPLNTQVVHYAAWPTPMKRDGDSNEDLIVWETRQARKRAQGINLHKPLGIVAMMTDPTFIPDGPARLTTDGRILTGSSAGMASGGQLNPAHARWLMGYPTAWDDCGAMVTRLSRKSRRRSSEP